MIPSKRIVAMTSDTARRDRQRRPAGFFRVCESGMAPPPQADVQRATVEENGRVPYLDVLAVRRPTRSGCPVGIDTMRIDVRLPKRSLRPVPGPVIRPEFATDNGIRGGLNLFDTSAKRGRGSESPPPPRELALV